MITLSTVGSWAFIAYLVGVAFFIGIRATPEEKSPAKSD